MAPMVPLETIINLVRMQVQGLVPDLEVRMVVQTMILILVPMTAMEAVAHSPTPSTVKMAELSYGDG